MGAMSDVSQLAFGADGLLPVIAQQWDTREVLMLAWMDAEALRRTLRTGRATYWSRSRGAYWVKGETSGNTQVVKEVRVDGQPVRPGIGHVHVRSRRFRHQGPRPLEL